MDKPYLGAWDIPENEDLVLTIKDVTQEQVMNESRKTEECMIIKFNEVTKPMIVNVTNARAIAKVAKSKFIEDWHGVRIALYTALVSAFGETRDAIRVRDFAPKLPDKVICADCGKEIQARGGVSAHALAEGTRGTYGRPLCWDCAEKAKKAADEKAKESDVL